MQLLSAIFCLQQPCTWQRMDDGEYVLMVLLSLQQAEAESALSFVFTCCHCIGKKFMLLYISR